MGENLVKDVDYTFSPSPGESPYKVYEKCETSATDPDIKPPENLLKKYFGLIQIQISQVAVAWQLIIAGLAQ